nr:IS66 family transposase [uncultured Rhodopila sp.]
MNRPVQAKRTGPRKGGGRPLARDPDETITAKVPACAHCRTGLTDAHQVLHSRYDHIDLPVVRPLVTRVERYAGHCPCCGGVTLAPVPAGMEDASPFSANIMALAIYLRFTHAISYRRLSQLFLHLYALRISEGALDAMLRRAKPSFDNEVTAILARLRRSRIVCSDETSVRIDGRTHWDWVFQNDQAVIHVVRDSRAACVVNEVMAGHRPSIWVSDLYGAQQGHADLWLICLAHQLRDCQYAIDAGDTVFAPRMKALLLRAVVLARRRKSLTESTRRSYLRRLDRDLNTIMALVPGNPHARRLRKRYGKVRNSLFTFLEHQDVPPDNNGSERELRPTATYRKVTGGFRSKWGADLFAGVRSVVGTAARRGLDAYQAIRGVLGGDSVVQPG